MPHASASQAGLISHKRAIDDRGSAAAACNGAAIPIRLVRFKRATVDCRAAAIFAENRAALQIPPGPNRKSAYHRVRCLRLRKVKRPARRAVRALAIDYAGVLSSRAANDDGFSERV